jgi:hypothetical protein
VVTGQRELLTGADQQVRGRHLIPVLGVLDPGQQLCRELTVTRGAGGRCSYDLLLKNFVGQWCPHAIEGRRVVGSYPDATA